MMESELIQQLTNLRSMFSAADSSDIKIITDYAWLIVKALNHETEHLGSQLCRQLLADYLRLPLERPSRLHSALLAAAMRVHSTYPEFRFAAFLRLWNTAHLLPEDLLPHTHDGKVYRPLAERVVRSYVRSLLFYPADALPDEQLLPLRAVHESSGLLAPQKMVVTKISVKDMRGRKLRFVHLVSPTGLEISCESHALHPSPLTPAPATGTAPVPPRHYVNVGQVYDVLLGRSKSPAMPTAHPRPYTLLEGYLSATPIQDIFLLQTGYVAGIDRTRNMIHVYDVLSRHFVASLERFSRERVGDFVRFVPIVPTDQPFKSAIIVASGKSTQQAGSQQGVPTEFVASHPTPNGNSSDVQRELAMSFPPKRIRVVSVNNLKGYISWELLNPADAIVESLSAFQLERGEVSPSFIRGFMSFGAPAASQPEGAERPSIPYNVGDELNAIIFLRRGQDGQKRPFVAKIIE